MLPTFVFLLFVGAWFLFSILVMGPLVETLQTNKISDVSRSVIQASGILVGFTGLSAFFYLGKTGDLSMSACSKAVDVTRLWAKCEIEYRSFLREIKRAEAEILSSQKDSKKLVTKEIEKLKKEIQKVKATTGKEWHEISGLESELNKQSEEMVKLMGEATKLLSVLTIITVSVFIASIVLSFLSELTGQPRFLKGAISLMIIGIASLILNWFSQQDTTNHMVKILNDYLFLNSSIVTARFEVKNMKEDFKYLFASKKAN